MKMKKSFTKTLAFVVVALMMLSTIAFADVPYDSQTGQFTVTGFTTAASKEVTLLVVPAGQTPAPDGANFEYIDQKTSGASDNSFTFTFALKNNAPGTYDVWVGSEELSSPGKSTGVVPTAVPSESPSPSPSTSPDPTYTVDGAVNFNGGVAAAKVELVKNGETKYTVFTPAKADIAVTSVTFSIAGVTADTYDLVVTKKNHTKATVTGVNVAGNVTISTQLELYAGNLNPDIDNTINALDLSTLIDVYSQNNIDIDLNEDGIVNALDLSLLVDKYGQNGVSITQ